MLRKVEVVPHDPQWPIRFEAEAQAIASLLGQEVVAIYHIGSTAIPGIKAKPIIDILVEVKDIGRIDGYNEGMAGLGYEPRGEYGIPGRRYFPKGDSFNRTHHVHMFQSDGLEVQRHLDFRDYMIAHPEEAQAYSLLKEGLARRFPEDIEGYMDGKDGFIKDVEKKAAAWRDSLSGHENE